MEERVVAQTSIRDAFAGKTVLLTGVTGFLGSGVLEKLLRSVPEVGRVLVLVRGNPKYSAEMRLRRRLLGASAFAPLRESMGMALATLAEAKIEVLEGDLSLPGLGLDPKDKKRLGDVDIVMHCAATVVFDAPLGQALRTNVEGPRQLLRLVREAGASPRVVHVSTAYVCGARRGLIPELLPGRLADGPELDWQLEIESLHQTCDAIEMSSRAPLKLDQFRAEAQRALGPAGGPMVATDTERRRLDWVKKELVAHGIARTRALGWNDVYNFTKALAERAVLAEAEAGELELAIVRPSIIESAWKQPEPGWLDGFKVMEPILLGYGRGEIPDFPGRVEGVVDIIPVDMVINAALAAAATALPQRHRVFQVTTSSRNPLRYGALFSMVRDYFRAHPMTGSDGYPIKAPDWQFRGRERLEGRLRMAVKGLRAARAVSQLVPTVLPAGRALRREVKRFDKMLTQAGYYTDIYGDYVEMETVFDDAHTVELHASLVDSEREEFGCDIGSLDWVSYFMEGHLPGVTQMLNAGRARRAQVTPRGSCPTRWRRGRRPRQRSSTSMAPSCRPPWSITTCGWNCGVATSGSGLSSWRAWLPTWCTGGASTGRAGHPSTASSTRCTAGWTRTWSACSRRRPSTRFRCRGSTLARSRQYGPIAAMAPGSCSSPGPWTSWSSRWLPWPTR